MIKKIISGGQTGVDRAALDAAIKLAIPHGGWIPQGRLTENGPLPPEYRLKETRSTSYADRTEKNVLDADGTLIISRGSLTGGSEYTREMAVKHNRLWLHIDLKQIPAFQAATTINDWISKKGIAILNVAGPRASKDPKIYSDTLGILASTYYLGKEDSVIHDNGGSRSGKDRRQNLEPYQGKDKRSGKDRRRGVDRRSGQARRRTPDCRSSKYWDGSWVERRDAFRSKQSRSS